MTTQAKHTPLPWSYCPEWDAIKASGKVQQLIAVQYPVDPKQWTDPETKERVLSPVERDWPANAELIVRAVNNHDQVLEALQACEAILSAIECGHDKPLATGQVLDAARAAIQAATLNQ